jgi:hypothetical protein
VGTGGDAARKPLALLMSEIPLNEFLLLALAGLVVSSGVLTMLEEAHIGAAHTGAGRFGDVAGGRLRVLELGPVVVTGSSDEAVPQHINARVCSCSAPRSPNHADGRRPHAASRQNDWVVSAVEPPLAPVVTTLNVT